MAQISVIGFLGHSAANPVAAYRRLWNALHRILSVGTLHSPFPDDLGRLGGGLWIPFCFREATDEGVRVSCAASDLPAPSAGTSPRRLDSTCCLNISE